MITVGNAINKQNNVDFGCSYCLLVEEKQKLFMHCRTPQFELSYNRL